MRCGSGMKREADYIAIILLVAFAFGIVLVLASCVSQVVKIDSPECVEGEVFVFNKKLCEVKE